MSEHRIEIERIFAADRQTVFDNWTSPEALKQWHCGTVTESIMDLKTGGEFLIRFAPGENGTEACVRGQYLEVVAPERLKYTWKWDSSDADNSVVTIDFVEQPDQHTLMRIVHEKLESAESQQGHTQGWEACLAGFDQFLAA